MMNERERSIMRQISELFRELSVGIEPPITPTPEPNTWNLEHTITKEQTSNSLIIDLPTGPSRLFQVDLVISPLRITPSKGGELALLCRYDGNKLVFHDTLAYLRNSSSGQFRARSGFVEADKKADLRFGRLSADPFLQRHVRMTTDLVNSDFTAQIMPRVERKAATIECPSSVTGSLIFILGGAENDTTWYGTHIAGTVKRLA